MAEPSVSILLTRPQRQAKEFARRISRWISTGTRVVISPLLEIIELPGQPDWQGFAGAIFSSVHGVRPPPSTGLPAYCVGPRVTAAAQTAGWNAHQMGGTAEELVAKMHELHPSGPLLHLHGRHTRGDVAKRLTDMGLPVRGQCVYDQRLLGLNRDAQSALNGENPCIVPLFSPRTARQFAAEGKVSCPLHLVLISNAVADELADLPRQSCIVAQSPDAASMEAALHDLYQRVEANPPEG